MKTKEQIKKYNKEYSARPDVIARAKIRNARPERKAVRNAYKNTERGKLVNKISRKRNWEKNAPLRTKKLLWRYGITPQEYDQMFERQLGRCAICKKISKEKLHVDHCH